MKRNEEGKYSTSVPMKYQISPFLSKLQELLKKLCVCLTQHIKTGITWPCLAVCGGFDVRGVMGLSTYIYIRTCLLSGCLTAISLHESILKLIWSSLYTKCHNIMFD